MKNYARTIILFWILSNLISMPLAFAEPSYTESTSIIDNDDSNLGMFAKIIPLDLPQNAGTVPVAQNSFNGIFILYIILVAMFFGLLSVENRLARNYLTLFSFSILLVFFVGCASEDLTGEAKGGGKIKAECNDRIDNDGDGYCDYSARRCKDGSRPGDSDCTSKIDTKEAECGNGVTEKGEAYDDGNTITERCGDAVKQIGIYSSADCRKLISMNEAYDDGNTITERCGDRIVQVGIYSSADCRKLINISEIYDDGNTITERCGDGIFQNGVYSDASCTKIINASEQCDDNNTISGDGCSSTCKIEQNISCTDSDVTPDYPNGLNYYLWGLATSGNTVGADMCCENNQCYRYGSYPQLQEWYCNDIGRKSLIYDCPNGCLDGACIRASQIEINITTPLNGQTVSGIIDVEAEATYPGGIGPLELYINDVFYNNSGTVCGASGGGNNVTSSYTNFCNWMWNTTPHIGQNVNLRVETTSGSMSQETNIDVSVVEPGVEI